jgi:hypothetical protein
VDTSLPLMRPAAMRGNGLYEHTMYGAHQTWCGATLHLNPCNPCMQRVLPFPKPPLSQAALSLVGCHIPLASSICCLW